jgi:hypothetical protein
MATTDPSSPAVFATVLKKCRTTARLSHDDFAVALIANGFPCSQYSHEAHDSPADRAWLAQTVEQMESAVLTDSWPFSDDATEFIDPAARALSSVLQVLWRLTAAMALDELARLDPP